MARRRLSPAQIEGGEVPSAPSEVPGGVLPGTGARLRPAIAPPIAHVAGDAATRAALDEVTGVLRSAEAEGRLVLSLPLGAVAADHLIRDRIAADPGAMAELVESLRQRGQQQPVEVTDLGPEAVPRYGLISGWRRLLALRDLFAETGEARFGRVLALVRQPQSGAEAYVAMVEENEIRSDLSFYERARIVLRALEAGVFPNEKKALNGLFGSALPAKRSKIKSFVPIVAALDPVLKFPGRISEKAGLALAREIEADPGLVPALTAALAADPAPTPEAEAQRIAAVLRGRSAPETGSDQPDRDESDPPAPLRVTVGPGRVSVSGAGVTPGFIAELEAWIAQRAGGTG